MGINIEYQPIIINQLFNSWPQFTPFPSRHFLQYLFWQPSVQLLGKIPQRLHHIHHNHLYETKGQSVLAYSAVKGFTHFKSISGLWYESL